MRRWLIGNTLQDRIVAAITRAEVHMRRVRFFVDFERYTRIFEYIFRSRQLVLLSKGSNHGQSLEAAPNKKGVITLENYFGN